MTTKQSIDKWLNDDNLHTKPTPSVLFKRTILVVIQLGQPSAPLHRSVADRDAQRGSGTKPSSLWVASRGAVMSQRTWCRGCYYITMYIYIWSRVSCSPPLILNVWYGGYHPPKNHFLDSTIYCKLPGIPFGIMLKKGSCWGAYIYTYIYIYIYVCVCVHTMHTHAPIYTYTYVSGTLHPK